MTVVFRSTQWERFFFAMLNADMSLLLNFTVSGEFDTPSCEFSACDLADTSKFVS